MAIRTASAPGRLATGLGWASVGLGVPQLLAPRRFLAAIGVRPSPAARAWTLVVGAREMAAAAGILALERPRPALSTSARVAGDAMDLALLAAALRNDARRPGRTRAAAGAVVAIAGADLIASVRLRRRHPDEESSMQVSAAVTTVKPREEVERAWHASEEIAELRRLGDVRVEFAEAPGDRGTEVRVTVDAHVAAGPLGAAVKKVAGTSPRQQAHDRLRRFKQELETGEVARSDGTPAGHTATMQPKQRPAQPVESATA